jgi:cbb3-type cytochrome oxidase subunit 3
MIDFISQNAGVIGLLFFVSVFAVIAFWAFRPASKDVIESYKNIPLKEDSHDLR